MLKVNRACLSCFVASVCGEFYAVCTLFEARITSLTPQTASDELQIDTKISFSAKRVKQHDFPSVNQMLSVI